MGVLQALFIRKSQKLCFNRRLKILYVSLPGLAILQLSQARRALKIAVPVYNRGPRCKANKQRFFLLVGRVPLYSCAVESVLREGCPVTRSPSCERLPPPTCIVSSSTYLFGWTDHGAVTASRGANPQTEAPRPSLATSTTPHPQYTIPNAVHFATTFRGLGAVLHVQTREL